MASPRSGAANATPSASTTRGDTERDHDVADEQVRPREHGVVDGALLGGDRLAVDDAEDPGASAVEVGRRGRRDRGAGAAVASSSNVPPTGVVVTDRDRSTAKPSLRTRQMWMQSASTTATGSTATCSA